MKSFEITENDAGIRLDKYARKVLNRAPASFIYKMLRKKNITLNDGKAAGSEILALGDVVKFFFSDDTFDSFKTIIPVDEIIKQSSQTTLDIVYEDDDIIVINKPPGMLSQKADAKDASANEYIIAYLLESRQLAASTLETFRPSVCNRLDRNTSGLLMAGKSLKGLQYLSAELRKRSLTKIYHCLVKGVIEKKETKKGYLLKDERENSVSIFADKGTNRVYIETTYEPVEVIGEYTYLAVHLVTGRSHQIRAHLASMEHPVIGDPKYGDEQLNRRFQRYADTKRQLLHAYDVRLSDGREFQAPLPEDFTRALEYARGLLPRKK